MTWIDDNKGQGPWDFEPQQNKWGYLNNPRWQNTPLRPHINYDNYEFNEPQVWTPTRTDGPYSVEDEKVHYPCGHWHKTYTPPIVADIFWQLSRGDDSVVGVVFDEPSMTLTYAGIYQPGVHMTGMEFYGDNLIIPTGSGVTANIHEINPSLNLEATYTPFNQYDKESAIDNGRVIVRDSDVFFYMPMSTDSFERIIRLDSSLARVARYIPQTIVIGTDLNYYAFKYAWGVSGWPPAYGVPITGGSWTAFWEMIPDGLFDAIAAVAYGAGTVISGASTSGNMSCDVDYLYITSWATPNSNIKKFNPTTGTIDAAVIPSKWGITSVCYGSYLYVVCGNTTADLIQFRKSDLTELIDLPLPYGMGSASPNESIIEMNGKLIVVNAQYIPADESAMYKIDPISMTIDQTAIITDATRGGPQCINNLNNKYILVGFNTCLVLYDFDSMEELCYLDRPNIGVSYPYYSTYIRSRVR